MHCTVINAEGTRVIICGRKAKTPPPCRFCGDKRRHTCDAPLCEECAVNAGPNSDLCPPHANQFFGAKSKAANA